MFIKWVSYWVREQASEQWMSEWIIEWLTAELTDWMNQLIYIFKTIRLFALDFYRVIVDEGAARVNYHAEKSRANNLIVLVSFKTWYR